MANHVDKIEVTVSGVDGLSVQGFELTVAVNAIPSIVIDALPIRRSDPGTKASAPKYSDLVELFNDLAEKAKTLETKATIKIKIIPGDEQDCKPQEVELKDWILSDVGLSTVTTYAAPTLTVVFRHRIVNLDRFGAIYEIPKNQHMVDDFYLSDPGSDVIDIWDNVYITWATSSPVEFLEIAPISHGGPEGDYASVAKNARERLIEFLPGDYLTCKGGLFLGNICACQTCLKAAIAELVTPQPFGVTTWVTLLNSVCPTTISQVIPTYDQDMLVLEPYEPWQKKTFEIDSRRVEGIDVVSIDPDPIYGVGMKKNFFDHTALVTDDFTRGEIPPNPENAECNLFGLYFPPAVLSEDLDKIKGRIEYYAENSIITAARRFCLGRHHGGQLDNQEDVITDENEEEMCEAVASAIYEGNYKKHCKAAITAIPTLMDKDGQLIYPGRVMGARDKDSGELFYGYLSRMTVKGTTIGGGSSYFELMTARPADGGASSYVEDGKKNECYS